MALPIVTAIGHLRRATATTIGSFASGLTNGLSAINDIPSSSMAEHAALMRRIEALFPASKFGVPTVLGGLSLSRLLASTPELTACGAAAVGVGTHYGVRFAADVMEALVLDPTADLLNSASTFLPGSNKAA